MVILNKKQLGELERVTQQLIEVRKGHEWLYDTPIKLDLLNKVINLNNKILKKGK